MRRNSFKVRAYDDFIVRTGKPIEQLEKELEELLEANKYLTEWVDPDLNTDK